QSQNLLPPYQTIWVVFNINHTESLYKLLSPNCLLKLLFS
ncbi:MAG: hypothetical protein ACI86L_002066, partial [Dokdonia sp.]